MAWKINDLYCQFVFLLIIGLRYWIKHFFTFSNPDFNVDEIEVVVSDNCSTDHTKQIVNKYPFVKYFCNEKNVRDANFSYALQRGSGEYLKLLNDTVRFPSGSLKFILDTIKKIYQLKMRYFFMKEEVTLK